MLDFIMRRTTWIEMKSLAEDEKFGENRTTD